MCADRMRLEVVTGRSFIVFCTRCGKQCLAGDVDGQMPVYADLNGEAWKAYYCSECAELVRKEVTP